MQINGPSHVHGAQPINSPHNMRAARPAETPSSFSTNDVLQISSEGDFLSKVHDLPDIRADRVAELQAAIASGAYDTDDKLDLALDRLLDEIA